MTAERDHAEDALRELGTLTLRTRRAGRSMATGLPLVGWGVAWTAGYPALHLLDGVPRIAVSVALIAFAMLLSWLPLRTTIRTGTESRMRWAWAVVLVSSPFLVAAASPPSMQHIALFLGALWSLAMCLFAVATSDPTFAAISMLGIVAAGVANLQELVAPLPFYGLTSGLPLLAVGAYRGIAWSRHV